MSSESYEICNNYQIYSPGEIWTIYFSNVKEGDTITIENYYTIYKEDNQYKIDKGNKIINTFGKEITFPNNKQPSGSSPCGRNTKPGRCYLMAELIPQVQGRDIHTSPDTKISMNNNEDNGFGDNCVTNNFTINYAPSGINPSPIIYIIPRYTYTIYSNEVKVVPTKNKLKYKIIFNNIESITKSQMYTASNIDNTPRLIENITSSQFCNQYDEILSQNFIPSGFMEYKLCNKKVRSFAFNLTKCLSCKGKIILNIQLSQLRYFPKYLTKITQVECGKNAFCNIDNSILP